MATLDSIATMLQDLSFRLKNVEAKVGSSGGGASASAAPAAVPRSAGPTLSFPPEFDQAAKDFDASTREMGKKAFKAAKFLTKIVDFNKDLVAKTSTCAQPSAEQLKTMGDQLNKWTRTGEKARLPTRNHEKALHELYQSLFSLLHATPFESAKNQFESMQFHTNRILVEFKGKDGDAANNHRKWVKACEDLLNSYKKFCLMNCKKGLQFKGTGDVTAAAGAPAPAAAAAPPPPASTGGGAPPPPPPSAVTAPPPPKKGGGGGMGALFASIKGIDQSSGRTAGLKRVKDKDRSCKNRSLVKSSKVSASDIKRKKKPSKKKAAAKPKKVTPPKQSFDRGQCCHYVEYQPEGAAITVTIGSPKEAVYLYRCGNCTVDIKGKFKSLTLVSCVKTKVGFADLISVCEVNSCKSVKLQSYGQCPSFCIDKTDGCYVYLSAESLDCSFTCAKISEVNVAWPDPKSDPENPDWIDKPIPEQYKHEIDLERNVVTANVSDLYSEC